MCKGGCKVVLVFVFSLTEEVWEAKESCPLIDWEIRRNYQQLQLSDKHTDHLTHMSTNLLSATHQFCSQYPHHTQTARGSSLKPYNSPGGFTKYIQRKLLPVEAGWRDSGTPLRKLLNDLHLDRCVFVCVPGDGRE